MKKLCFVLLFLSFFSSSLSSQEVDLCKDFKESKKLSKGYYIYLMLKLESGQVVFDIDGFTSSHRILKNKMSCGFSSQEDYFQKPIEVLAGGEIEVNSEGLISRINETTSLVNTRPDIAEKMKTPGTAIKNIKGFMSKDPGFARLFSEDIDFIAFDENDQHLNMDFKSSRVFAHEVGSVVSTLFTMLRLSNSIYDDYLNNKDNIRGYLAEALKDFIGKRSEVVEKYPFLDVYFEDFINSSLLDKELIERKKLKELYVKLYLALEDFEGDYQVGWFINRYNNARSSFSGLENEKAESFLRHYLDKFIMANDLKSNNSQEDINVYNADILISSPKLIYDLFLVLYERTIGGIPVDRNDFVEKIKTFMFENREQELVLMFLLKRVLETKYPSSVFLEGINERFNLLNMYSSKELIKVQEGQKKIINTTDPQTLHLKALELQTSKTRSMLERYSFVDTDANRSNMDIVERFLDKVIMDISSSDIRDRNIAMGLLLSKDVIFFMDIAEKNMIQVPYYEYYSRMLEAIRDYDLFIQENRFNLTTSPSLIRLKNQKLSEMTRCLKAYRGR